MRQPLTLLWLIILTLVVGLCHIFHAVIGEHKSAFDNHLHFLTDQNKN